MSIGPFSVSLELIRAKCVDSKRYAVNLVNFYCYLIRSRCAPSFGG